MKKRDEHGQLGSGGNLIKIVILFLFIAVFAVVMAMGLFYFLQEVTQWFS